jgi:hypothetical protein
MMARRMKSRIDLQHAVSGPRNLHLFADARSKLADSAVPETAQEDHHVTEPHELERTVLHELLAQPAVAFPSLVVRRTPDGLCLQGVMECEDSGIDVCSIVRRVAGVERVLSQLVVHSASPESRLSLQ